MSSVDDDLAKAQSIYNDSSSMLSDFEDMSIFYSSIANRVLLSISVRPWDSLSIKSIEIMKLIDYYSVFLRGLN